MFQCHLKMLRYAPFGVRSSPARNRRSQTQREEVESQIQDGTLSSVEVVSFIVCLHSFKHEMRKKCLRSNTRDYFELPRTLTRCAGFLVVRCHL